MLEKMIVVVFDTYPQAVDGILALKQLDREGAISVHSASVIKKNSDGATELLKTEDAFPIHAVGGTAIGSVVGLLGGPVGVALGASWGAVLGGLHDLHRSGVSAEFVDEVSTKLTPGKFALVADISEEWITPLDIKMENLGGQIFRTGKRYVEIDQIKADVAALNAEIAQLGKEMKNAHGEQKAKLQTKVEKLKVKRKERIERAKKQLEQMKKERAAKVEALKKKASKARGETKAAIEARVTRINKDHQEILKGWNKWEIAWTRGLSNVWEVK